MQIDENAQYDHNTELNAENFATEKVSFAETKGISRVQCI